GRSGAARDWKIRAGAPGVAQRVIFPHMRCTRTGVVADETSDQPHGRAIENLTTVRQLFGHVRDTRPDVSGGIVNVAAPGALNISVYISAQDIKLAVDSESGRLISRQRLASDLLPDELRGTGAGLLADADPIDVADA